MRFFNKIKFTRRSFLKTSSAAAALGAMGCGSKLKSVDEMPVSVEDEGKWITGACWHNCGGRCVNKALVSDGIVIRQKTDDTHADSFENPQLRGCVRGRSQRKQVFAADRLKYPMVRKNWKPGGMGDNSLRGRDEWIRISWDEALKLVAEEFLRVKKEYGNESLMVDGDGIYTNLVGKFGGFVAPWTTSSFGTWMFTPTLCGYSSSGANLTTINDRFDLFNTDTIIMFGINSAWSSPGMPNHIYNQLKKSGKEFICIDPVYNETAAMLNAKWIPIRPTTDTALLLGIAHTLLTQDSLANPLMDWDFLKRCSIGFDADSMPEGANKKENFKDYLLGTYDKQPKNAKWAFEICGVSEENIKWLAQKMGMQHKVAILTSWGVARANNTDNLPQLFMTIGAMTGHMGKPGHMTGVSAHRYAASGGPFWVTPGGQGLPSSPNPVSIFLNENEHWDAIMGKPFHDTGCHRIGKWRPMEVKTINVKMVIYDHDRSFQARTNFLKGVEAIRSKQIDCIVAPSIYLTNNAKYADIVLPINTPWERPGGVLTGAKEILVIYSQICESLYESKSDYWVVQQLAKRMGLNVDEVFPHTEKQLFFNQLAGSQVMKPDGSGMEPLCTITEKDIMNWGVTGKPQEGRIRIDTLVEQGVYQLPRKKGDIYEYIAFKELREDPEKYPSKFSKSGKLEIYCQELKDKVNNMGYSEIKGIPTYIPPVNGYEHTFANWNKKTKGKYPYQMVTMHYMRRSHTEFDNVKQLAEAFKNPVYISEEDAKREGIVSGNTVLMESMVGKTLRTALVTKRVMPGCVVMLHGKWSEVDEETGLDYAGTDNVLMPAVSTGQAVTGYNTMVINICKHSDTPLMPDAEKPLRIVNL